MDRHYCFFHAKHERSKEEGLCESKNTGDYFSSPVRIYHDSDSDSSSTDSNFFIHAHAWKLIGVSSATNAESKPEYDHAWQSPSSESEQLYYQGYCASVLYKCKQVLISSFCQQKGQLPLPFLLLLLLLLHGFKKPASFPHNEHVNDFGETTQRDEVARQKVNTFIFTPHVVYQLADVSQCYATWANITRDSFVLDIVKHGTKLDFCNKAKCSNYTPGCSLTAEVAKAVDNILLFKHVSPAKVKLILLSLVFSPP